MSTTTTGSRCGTPRGYQDHIRAHEPTCPACRRARADYVAQHRRANPHQHRRRIAVVQLARDRALRRLARLHPAQLAALHRDELRKIRDTA